MRRADFHFALPPELIAQEPLPQRRESRLLVLERDGAVRDDRIDGFDRLLRAGDLLVFNDTRVIPARLYGEKETGGRVEVLVERLLGRDSLLAQVRASKSPRSGSRILLEGGGALEVEGRDGEFFRLRCPAGEDAMALLERCGHVPLPPYIDRPDRLADHERYQTVFARSPGAVAAPTAGLHFDDELLRRIRARGVNTAFVTLHVGAGTFQPVRVDDLASHRMHAERYVVPEALPAMVHAARDSGGRVVAIGTTVVRTLESAAAGGTLAAGEGETRLFITPGYRFQVVDALLTNFHLPESTLLMLVSAFAGRDRVMQAYAHAVRERYRFFSYGDAMFIPGRAEPSG